jgi:phytoene dehydrogenase-like protein
MSAHTVPDTTADVIVVGSGPNGLAAAVVLARAGLAVEVLEAESTIGGGARTLDLGLAPGITHDVCSAVHPMALASPFFRAFDLPARGVELTVPEVSYAQGIDASDGGPAIAWRDLDRTAEGLGADGPAWRDLLGPLAADVDPWLALALGDKRGLEHPTATPSGLLAAARYGLRAGINGLPTWDLPLRTARARALLTGVGAHVISPLPSLSAAGTAIMLAALAHGPGWPVPVGGSQSIIDALADDLRLHGGSIRTGERVTGRHRLAGARAVLLDTSAETAADVLQAQLPASEDRALRAMGHRNAAAKVDFVLSGPVPWSDPDMGRASTVHLGGTRAQMARAEREVHAGRLPAAPVVLASDPTVVDPAREVDGLRPLWAYAHVPLGCDVDPTERVTAQIERFAPGFRDLVVASQAIPADRMHEHDQALVGGDIGLGATTFWRMFARPTASWDPYRLTEGAWLCSAATPPGPGVHGLSGYYAAVRVLRDHFGIRRVPDLGPGA